MEKHQINLVIKQEEVSPLLKKLNVIAPIVAVSLLSIFVVTFFITLLYTNSNINRYNSLRRETESIEQKIGSQKNTEGIYLLTNSLLSSINQVLTSKKNFNPLLDAISDLEVSGTDISGASADQKGNVELTLAASSSVALIDFVHNIMLVENKKLLSDVTASGISRNKKGQYLLNITFKAGKELLP